MLITGGTGAFGQAFVRRMLREKSTYYRRLCVYSRDEYKQAIMRENLGEDDRLRWFIGDVRDRERLKRAMTGVSTVVHAAALKRIEVGAYNPDEMVKTNVIGTMNVIEAALETPSVRRVVYLSTDKAWQPVSPYGQSKALSESLILAANNIGGVNAPKFVVTRYGNVSNSTGSVIPTWRRAIERGEPLKITDPECTRFWMTMDEACDLVLEAIQGEDDLYIPTLPAYRLGDLLNAIVADISPPPLVQVTGLPAYEKLHEGMADGNTSDVARRMSVQEIRDGLRRLE